MKKALLYFLVFSFLSNSVILEVFKLPLLISHYLDHVDRNSQVSPMDFLSMHYWGKDIEDNDKDQDMKLPLKKICHSNLQILFCNTQIYRLPKIGLDIANKFPFFYTAEIINLHIHTLDRPPEQFPSV